MAKSVCVIGAGPSGIIAAKTLLHNAPTGAFAVTVMDPQHDVGGLWPTSRTDSARQIHPLMVANQSRHTMHFSDLAWDDDEPPMPAAWMVGRYLRRYVERYLTGNPGFNLRLGTRVVRASPRSEGGWDVVVRVEGKGEEETHAFDRVVVASGFFGKPVVPECLGGAPSDVPVVHSSAYRDLNGFLGKGRTGGGKILVVGGQMSGVETAATVATHLSSAVNSPGDAGIQDIDKYAVHHLVQRPTWVFPLFTSPEAKKAAAPFLPLDFSSCNLNNRPQPLLNSQGHIDEATAQKLHAVYEGVVGTDQSPFSPHLHANNEDKTLPPFVAVSDMYCNLVRDGHITLTKGRLESLSGSTATISPTQDKIDDIAAIVVATGFDASPGLDFLPDDVLKKLHHSPQHLDQPITLAFHGTHHPEVPGLGFVGFYRAPYWGVMQMQARFLSRYWSLSEHNSGSASSKLTEALALDDSVSRTLGLRDDPRCSQFPMGDYPFIVQDIADALSLPLEEASTDGLPLLSHNDKPLDMVTPSRYVDETDSPEAKEEARKTREATRQVALAGLTTPRYVARAVFRSLLGTWRLERDLRSALPSHPSGHFSGTAQFLLRHKTQDGVKCSATGDGAAKESTTEGLEYLYIERGEFKADNGFTFTATRRYVWRYDDATDRLSVWFVKPDDDRRADYLFHEVDFLPGVASRGWPAEAGHLCIDDFYNVRYNFAFGAVNLREWTAGYKVRGPKKDYTISGTYTR